jgi:hypothetical protein
MGHELADFPAQRTFQIGGVQTLTCLVGRDFNAKTQRAKGAKKSIQVNPGSL